MVRDREIDAVAGALHVSIGVLLRRLRQRARQAGGAPVLRVRRHAPLIERLAQGL